MKGAHILHLTIPQCHVFASTAKEAAKQKVKEFKEKGRLKDTEANRAVFAVKKRWVAFRCNAYTCARQN